MRTRRRWRRGGVLAMFVAVLLSAPVAAPPRESDVFQFRFEPLDGSRFEEYEKKTVTRQMGQLPADVLVMESTSLVRVARIPAGYSFTYEVRDLKVTRRGRDDSDLARGLRGVQVVIECDPKGKLLAVRNLDKLLAGMCANLPFLVASLVTMLSDERKMREEIQTEWDERIADLVGLKGHIGAVWVIQRTLPANGAEVPYYAATAITDRVKSPGYLGCIRMKWRTDTDPAAVRQLAGSVLDRVMRKAPKRPAQAALELSVQGERVFEPATLRLHSEQTRRRTRTNLEVPFLGPTPVVIEEVKETRWTYPR